jgi:hypothetical protein
MLVQLLPQINESSTLHNLDLIVNNNTITIIMVLAASINQDCIISGSSRLVYTPNPISPVYIGPDIDTALCELTAEL